MKKTIKGGVHVTHLQDAEFEIAGITLLSTKEAKVLPVEIRNIGCWWWLQSPGGYQNYAAGVYIDGSVYYCGINVDYNYGCVRPALLIDNLKSLNLKFGDKVNIFDLDWTVIGDETVLCDGNIGRTPFRIDWRAEDANDYERSDVKKYLDNWLADKINNK